MSSKLVSVVTATTPFGDQRPGTSGLRKKVTVFQQQHYTENFVQAVIDSIPDADRHGKDTVLVLGGDGRFYMRECIRIILRICAANGVSRVIVGTNGILSTPAGSNLIRKRSATGGILLTASHNPGGPTADFGIKYNLANGGPAPESVTEAIAAASRNIKNYRIISGEVEVDLSKPQTVSFEVDGGKSFVVEVVDSVDDYVILMKEIFDFDMIRKFVKANATAAFRFDALHGVTGPYMERIFVKELGIAATSLHNCNILPDFGGMHPDPNLTYAHSLVEEVEKSKAIFGAASDGDGDRNMIIACGCFVNPCDSVAIIAEYAAKAIPYFVKRGGLPGVARSMPTSSALDRVAASMGIKCYEVPTGWKFFGNLMDAGLCALCGEESFGTGADHVREKDGLWAILAWLSIMAYEGLKAGAIVPMQTILQGHYERHGRSYFARYDYEDVEGVAAKKVVDRFNAFVSDSSNIGKEIKIGSDVFKVAKLIDFTYTDPIDHSVSKKQGLCVAMEGGTRIVLRASGTGSAATASTLRVYLERVVDKSGIKQNKDAVLAVASQLAEHFTNMKEITGRSKPDVVT